MVVTAQTPGAQATPSNDTSTPPSSTSIEVPSTDLVSDRKAVRHSERVRFLAAGACLVVAALGATATSLNPGEQPLKLVAFLVVATATVVTIVEAATSWIFRRRQHSVFDPLPLVGCAGITVAVALETCFSLTPSQSLLLITAPVIAAATVCLGNGLAILGLNSARSDRDYLFPKERSTSVQRRLGDEVELRAGDIVPCDGRVNSGSIGIDERALSPVGAFRIREEEEILYAGSEVLAGQATITALSTSKDSCLAQLQNATAAMAEEVAEGLRVEDIRASRWTAFVLCFIAAALAIAWKERTLGAVAPLLAAGTVLLLGSICQVSEYLYGQRRSLVQRWIKRGFLLGSASSVRDLARVSRVECDASRSGPGSLIRASRLEILDDRLAAPALCDFLASLLGRAEDPILLAAAEYCRQHAPKLSLERVLELREYAGRGICGVVHGVELSIGSEDFLVERGIMIQPTEGAIDYDDGEPILLVAIDDDIVARFWISSSQEHLLSDDSSAVSAGRDDRQEILFAPSTGVARELGDDTLLVRGNESDLVGQTAKREVSLFSAEEGTVRRATVVAFTPDILPLRELLSDCRAQVRSVDRLRLMVGFGGLITVASAFGGVFTPIIPFAWLTLTAIAVKLPRGELSK